MAELGAPGRTGEPVGTAGMGGVVRIDRTRCRSGLSAPVTVYEI